ncbi:hypothetical protein [Salmonella phage Tennessee]
MESNHSSRNDQGFTIPSATTYGINAQILFKVASVCGTDYGISVKWLPPSAESLLC